jgi:hypothetical protein
MQKTREKQGICSAIALGYQDSPSPNGKYKPGSWEGKVKVARVGGKLRLEYDQTNFDVAPDTLKRTATKDKLPLFVAKEIAGK